MRRRRTGAVALAVALLAGCGSSVPTGAAPAPVRGAAGDPEGLSVAPDTSGPGSATTPPDGLPSGDGAVIGGPAGPAGSSTTAGAGGTGSGSSTGARGGGASSTLRHGPGVTAKEIFVGVTYTADAEQANRAIGAEISQGDTKANAEAVIAEVNERGGVAGRRLVPVFFAYEAQSSQTNAQQDQAACATFTEDNKVFAVFSDGYTDAFRECMRKHGVLQVVGGTLYGEERGVFAGNPQLFNLHGPTQDRWFAALVPALVRRGYFTGWNTASSAPGPGAAVVGVIGFDTPMWTKPVPRVLLPALARAGHAVDPDNVVYISAPESNAELGGSVAEIQSAVLRFQQSGVTHVLFLDTTGGLTLLFTASARSQSYFPRWGVGSTSGVQALYDQGAFTEQDVRGMVGVGWAPSLDLRAADGDKHATPATVRCMELMKRRTGQEYATTNEASIALSQCDEVELTVTAIGRIRGSIDVRSAIAAIESIGAPLTMAARPRMFFSPAKHDGVELAWDMVWDRGCSCVKYLGEGRSMR